MRRRRMGYRSILVLLLSCLAVAAQDPRHSAPIQKDQATVAEAQEQPAEEEAPAPEPYAGSLRQGLEELVTLAKDEGFEQALEVADRLLVPTAYARWSEERRAGGGFGRFFVETLEPVSDALGLNGHAPGVRAEVHYAKAIVQGQAGEILAADEQFERSRAMAGAGSLRQSSIYNLGLIDFMVGEQFRSRIPELAGPNAAPTVPTPPTPPGTGQAEEQPDPLRLARVAYERAREHFVERLKTDWRDPDTQANVELVQRRLRELEELEKKRQKEQQQQQQQQQDQQEGEQQDQEEQQEGDPSEEQQDSESSQQDEEGQPEPTPNEEGEDQRDSEDGSEGADQDGDDDQSEDQSSPQEAEPQELHLTREQVMELLKRLNEIEEQGEQVREQLRQRRRVRVKRDW